MTNTLEIGKLPPQAVELEEAVIGGMLLEKDAVIEVIDILKKESFYKEEHQIIYKAVIDLFNNNKAIDILTVTEKLRQLKELDTVGGPAYLTQLTGRIASAAHIEFHARIVQQKYIQRELIRASTEIQNRAFDESIDVNELIDFSEGELFNIAQGNLSQEAAHIGTIGKEVIKDIEDRQKQNKEYSGLPTGIATKDKVTSGYGGGKLILLAARPSQGKTTLALVEAANMALDFQIPVAFFSLEMTKKELARKIFASRTGIEYGRLNDGKLSEEEWIMVDNIQRKLEDSPLYIDDTPGITPTTLRAKARRLKLKYNIEMIFVDYLQLMSCPQKGSREQEISTISRALKILAKELNIPVKALSQLARKVEDRPDKKPMLQDLRESGSLEQDADIIEFIYRPEHYKFYEYEDGTSTKNIIEIIYGKNRGGKTPTIRLIKDTGFTIIKDIDDQQIAEQEEIPY